MNRREFLMSSVALATLAAVAPGALAQEKLTILGSVPNLGFPFFVHMLNQIKADHERLRAAAARQAHGAPAP